TLYFAANDGEHGIELWKSNGTAGGTVMVQDMYPGSGVPYPGAPVMPNSSAPGNFTVFNNSLYFTANDGAHGAEWWALKGDNKPPTANAGGPYTVTETRSLTLSAAASTDPDGDPLTYRWDVNGDGVFGDATGVNPTLTWNQLHALGINGGAAPHQARVRVSAGHGHHTQSPAGHPTVP